MRYEATIKSIKNINTFTAEIDLGFGVKVVADLRLKDVSSLKGNDKIEEAIECLEKKLVGRVVELDIRLAKEHSLAIIYLDDKNINQELLQKGLAKKYIKKE